MRKAHVIPRQLKLFQMQALFIYQYAPKSYISQSYNEGLFTIFYL